MTIGKKYFFSTKLKIKKNICFENIFAKKNNVLRTKNFVCIAKDNNFEHPRIGMKISKKIINSAVSRNYIKRIIRESFRLNQSRLVKSDFILLIKKNFNPENKIQNELEQLWKLLETQ